MRRNIAQLLSIALIASTLILLTSSSSTRSLSSSVVHRFLPLAVRNAAGFPAPVTRFAPYTPVPVEVVPNAPAYTPNLSAVANRDVLAQLNDAQRASLEGNGFVVVPQGYEQIYEIYQTAYWNEIPAFVTTDALLHTFHVLFNYALRLAEKESFLAELEALTSAMLAASEADYAASTGAVQEAAWQRLAYFAVAARLLDPQAEIPASVQQAVEQELALIEAHAGFARSPIFGYPEDYSQYVPRGHYTRNPDFERYFRAMMWYGRMAFRLMTPDDPPAARRETRAALLTVRALYTTRIGDDRALDVWERIYAPTAFFVGFADDLTPHEYAQVARQVYGGLPDPAALADEARLDRFIDTARQLRKPAIVGGWVWPGQDPTEVTQGFRFMGQRFIPDSYIFQQLVYDKVGRYRGTGQPFTLSIDRIRGFPRGLDVPAVLGSARALEILSAAGDTQYENYPEQLAKLQREFGAVPEAQWTSNLYWNWLYTLRPLLEEKGEGFPYFMQSPAWVDKDLHTWLGSWTELRHDTILYAKQSYTGIISVPERTRGYVEPQPWVYARLAALTAQLRTGLERRGLLNAEMAAKLDEMERLSLALKRISEKELRGEPLSEAEYDLILNIGNTLEFLTTFSEAVEGEITSAADDRMAIVVDVHTDPNSGLVLEEGVGDAFPMYVVVLVEGQQVVAMGGVFSYYEFKWPMHDRLTDESWQAMEPKPPRPSWTSSFIIP